MKIDWFGAKWAVVAIALSAALAGCSGGGTDNQASTGDENAQAVAAEMHNQMSNQGVAANGSMSSQEMNGHHDMGGMQSMSPGQGGNMQGMAMPDNGAASSNMPANSAQPMPMKDDM